MSYYILPKTNNDLYINPIYISNNISTSNIYNNYIPYVSTTLYNYYYDIINELKTFFLHNNKNELTHVLNDLSSYTLEELIKIINPYEYIYTIVPGSKFSVSKLKTNTNIFYDFLEIITILNIFDSKQKNIHFLLITENYKDIIQCIEIVRETDNINNDIFFFNEINDSYLESIKDTIVNYDFIFFEANIKTTDSYVIDLVKIIMVIFKQMKNSGTCIIKIDSIFYKPVVDILYLLSSFFEKVYIIKPNTNNITTFEKYIVCKYFILSENKTNVYNNNYNILNNYLVNRNFKNKKILSLIESDTPYYFINKINDINTIIGQQQLESLHQIINILNSRNKNDKIELIKKTNIQKSVNWCEKFKLPCNKFTEKTNIFLPVVKENLNNKYFFSDDDTNNDTNLYDSNFYFHEN
jgi:hypothetical protein